MDGEVNIFGKRFDVEEFIRTRNRGELAVREKIDFDLLWALGDALQRPRLSSP